MADFLHSIAYRIKNFFQRPRLFRRLLRITAILAGLLLSAVSGFVFLVWIGFFGAIPDKKDLQQIHHPIASEVYSADSVLLGRYYLQERSPVDDSEIPASLKNALISTEDARFYEHNGIDIRSLFRVFFKTILFQDEGSGGGSTLTQQLAKNLYPRRSYKTLSLPINKVREFLIARRLENLYSKDDLLVLYLNTIPFGDNTYGIKTAADRFFSVPVKDLSADQSAVLVGMLKATHSYNPRLFPERALKRRNVVISQMKKYGFLKEEEAKMYIAKPLELHYNNTTNNAGLAPYFRSYIQDELIAWCREHTKADGSSYNLYTDGLKIYTTIDSRLQDYAEEAMRSQMKILQERFQNQMSKPRLESLARIKLTQLAQYRELKNQGVSENEIDIKLRQPVKTKIFSWDGDQEAEMSIYDSLKHHLQFLQAGVLAVEPSSGSIRVWVGGIDHRFFQFDHVKESTKRQVGSTIKPIFYAAALESGISPCDYISARKTSYTNMKGWTPENSHDDTYQKKYSMEGGLAGSVNTVSVKLLEETGIDKAIGIARKMGITSDMPSVPSIALGTPSISVMEMVSAYAVLANNGVHVKPRYLLAITDQNDEMLQQYKQKDNAARALTKETSQMMVHMLKRVVSEGTGSSLRSKYGITNDVAGKTGTTQSNVDGWFIAIMPKLVVGCWVGADDPRMHFRSTALGQGSATALPIVAKFLQLSNKDKSLSNVLWSRFEPLPENLQKELDCKVSKSNLNIFQRIFKIKKGVKVTRFKNKKGKHG